MRARLSLLLAPSLHGRLMGALALLVAVVAGGTATFLVEREGAQRLGELDARLTRIADLLGHSLAQPLWNVDTKSIERQLATLAPNPELVEIDVTAVGYGTVATTKGREVADANERRVRVRPIQYSHADGVAPQKVGEVRVVFTAAPTEQAITRARGAIVGIVAAVVLVLYAATYLLLKRMVGAPISRLEGIVDRIAAGDFEARCPVESTDELGRLATRVNFMAERLRESALSLVDHVLDGIISIDGRGTVESFNPAAERLFGYGAAEVIGRNVRMLMPDPYRAGHDGFIRSYVATGEAKIIGIGREVIGLRKDGTTFPMDLAVSEFRVSGRRFFTGIVRDITERKRAEQALRDADRHKDEFLAMLSHELRNPLAALSTAAHVLRAAAPGDPAALGAHGVIERQTEHMARLIEDLLDITRVRLGKLSLKREAVDLAKLATDVIGSWRAGGSLHGRAAVQLDPSPAWIDADRARIEQILSNLLHNALKFTPADGEIRVTLREERGEAVLRVTDNGRGIAPEALGLIFEPFVQGEPNLDRAEGGLGLGLALVKRLAELHGGTVSAESGGPGQGASFIVRLPASSAPAERPQSPARAPAAATRRRVLVIEDNDDGRQMLCTALALQGYQVGEARNGASGLAAAAEQQPDIILLDIGLPDMDGYDVARRLRAEPHQGTRFIIAVSGYGQDNDYGRARAAGFDAHVVKPVSAQRLGELIAQLTVERGVTQA